jgi:hypothetical protein
MSLLARFEGVAEILFTGAFKRNQDRLQPVVIAKELIKSMLKNKQISVSTVYVPNVYRIFLNSCDWSPLASFGDAFLIELSKYVYAEGSRLGFTFLTKPAIELHADANVAQHQLVIEVDFDDSIVVEWQDEKNETLSEENLHEKTNIFREEVRTNFKSEQVNGRNPRYYLEVIEGLDCGHIYPLNCEVVYIGRHSQCEMSLIDPEVSRRHLKVTANPSGWLIDDLGSTNGTWLNGQRITRQALSPGDRIQIGQTVLMLKRYADDETGV